jgi:hypothetical protein
MILRLVQETRRRIFLAAVIRVKYPVPWKPKREDAGHELRFSSGTGPIVAVMQAMREA